MPTIRAVARVGTQPLLEDALVHLQDFLEPREPRAHSLVYFLSLCSMFLFHVGHLSSPACPLLLQSQGCVSTLFLTAYLVLHFLFDSLLTLQVH